MAKNPESGVPGEESEITQGIKTDAGPQPLTFEQVVSPEHLEIVSQASGGFRFMADPKLPPGRTGYTDLKTRTIYYNPLLLSGSEELGIKPWKPVDIKGFTYHEAGHHAPEVVSLQEKLIGDLKKIEIPEAYKGSPAAEERFIGAIWSNLDNTLADIWLESFMGRRPYYPVGKAITEFQTGKGDIGDYKGISAPEQLMQVLLRSRYFKNEGLEEKVSPEVFESYQKIVKSGAMNAMMEKGPFENYFATLAQREKCVNKKMDAYKQVFLPEYLNLLEKELEKRKQQKQQQKEQQQQGQSGQPGQPGEGEPQAEASSGAPLTKEEEQEIIDQLMEELDKAGKERQTQAPAEEEENQMQSAMQKIRKMLEEQQEPKEEGKSGEESEGKPAGETEEDGEGPKKKTGEEAIKELGKEFDRKKKAKERAGKAEALQVSPEVIKRWEDIEKKYKTEIESMTTELSEVFLDDRRKKMEYLRREGIIVPGLEFETVAAHISGESDPQTKMSPVRNPEFLETELEFIVDTSGSMSGEKIEKSVDLLATITASLKKVREMLSAENLVTDDAEQPFRLGVTKFSNAPERVTKLTDSINEKKEVTIIEKVSQVGGGTEESAAIGQVYEELKLGKKNVIKIIVVLTDGEGNQEGVRPIIQQIEKDEEVIFLAVGLGSDKEGSQAIVDTYLKPLSKREGNVYGLATENPAQALPGVLEFLKREVNKRKQ